jgi:hypothetical protein
MVCGLEHSALHIIYMYMYKYVALGLIRMRSAILYKTCHATQPRLYVHVYTCMILLCEWVRFGTAKLACTHTCTCITYLRKVHVNIMQCCPCSV